MPRCVSSACHEERTSECLLSRSYVASRSMFAAALRCLSALRAFRQRANVLVVKFATRKSHMICVLFCVWCQVYCFSPETTYTVPTCNLLLYFRLGIALPTCRTLSLSPCTLRGVVTISVCRLLLLPRGSMLPAAYFHYRWQTSEILAHAAFRLSFACLLAAAI